MSKRGAPTLLARAVAVGVLSGSPAPGAGAAAVGVPIALTGAAVPAAASDSRIAYTKEWSVQGQPGPDDRSDIYTVRPDGTDHRRLTFVRDADNPQWSPNGTRIAFERPGAVWVMKADGSAKQRLVEGRLVDWMPTRGRILVVRDLGREGVDTTWLLHTVATGAEEELPIDLPLVAALDEDYPDYSEWSYATEPAVSPDGELLSVMLSRYDDDGSGYGYDFASIFTVRLDGTGLTRIPKYSYSWGTPTWAPGGGQLLYWAEEPRGYCVSGLRSVRLDGSSGSVDIQKRCAMPDPGWSPDGRRVVFTNGRSGSLQVARRDGSRVRSVLPEVDGVVRTEPDWRAGR